MVNIMPKQEDMSGGSNQKDKKKRSRVDLFQNFSDYIKKSEKPFSKSALRDIGLNAQTAENYITCFEIAQLTPKIIVLRTGKRTSIGKEKYPEPVKIEKMEIKSRRTMVEIFQDVSKFINRAHESFYKSSLNEIGLDSNTAEIYIKSFEIAQQTPKIIIQRSGNKTIVAKKES